MTQNDYICNLSENLETLDQAIRWLKRSLTVCSDTDLVGDLTEEQVDAFEAFTGRYARVSDMIIQKVFRAIDAVEFEEGGTLIDVINRAHKRGFIETIEEIREIRELRNEIAHEYVLEDLKSLFADILKFAPRLIEIADRVKVYCRKHTG